MNVMVPVLSQRQTILITAGISLAKEQLKRHDEFKNRDYRIVGSEARPNHKHNSLNTESTAGYGDTVLMLDAIINPDNWLRFCPPYRSIRSSKNLRMNNYEYVNGSLSNCAFFGKMTVDFPEPYGS